MLLLSCLAWSFTCVRNFISSDFSCVACCIVCHVRNRNRLIPTIACSARRVMRSTAFPGSTSAYTYCKRFDVCACMCVYCLTSFPLKDTFFQPNIRVVCVTDARNPTLFNPFLLSLCAYACTRKHRRAMATWFSTLSMSRAAVAVAAAAFILRIHCRG